MKKPRLFALCLSLALLLSGCSLPSPAETVTDWKLPAFLDPMLDLLRLEEDGENPNTVTIYRVNADPTTGGELIRAEACTLPRNAASELTGVLELFVSPSRDETLAVALPAGVSIQGWTQENRAFTLNLSPEFLTVPPMEQTIAAFCAALTLCKLDGVESVTVTAGGEVLFSGLVPEAALLSDTESDPYARQLRLYFADSQGRYLVSEYHTLTLSEDTSPERYVVEELLRGPNNSDLHSPIPAGTTLRSCTTVDGVCVVDLSAEFLENRPDTALGERLAVYSIVNSLTALSGVDTVNLLVEGQPVSAYTYRSLAEPLGWYGETVGPVSTAKGELDAALYLVTPDLTAITPLPFLVSLTNYGSRAEAVLAALLNAAEPGYPALFSGSGSVTGIAIQGYFCTVDLSESFFASLPTEARSAAVQSIAATLCSLEEIASVYFTIGGSPATFEGTDWSGPWTSFDEIEVS